MNETVPALTETPVEPSPPGMYFADLTERAPTTLPPFNAAIDACRNPDEGECTLRRTAGFDARSSQWVIFDVDPGELAPGDAWLGTATDTSERATFEGRVERRSAATIRRALGAFRAITPGQDLVTHVAEVPYSIMAYNGLVALGGPLEGWAMWIESSALGGYVLHILRRDQTGDRVLAIRSEDPHCHDGRLDAESPAVTSEPCSPLGIDAILLSPDRTSLLVLGTRAMNGHGGAPAMHWVVPVPADLLPPE